MSDHYPNDFLMKLACLVSKRSKDPHCQVGACIVNVKKKQIVGLGYNGFPNGCSNDEFSWALDEKKLYVCHAELNAICNSNNREDFKDCTMVVTRFPCNDCAKFIIQFGIKDVKYMSKEKMTGKKGKASQKMFAAVGVSHECIIPEHYQLKIDFQGIGGVQNLDPVNKEKIDKNKTVPRGDENQTTKREGVMEWDEYVMAITLLIATRSGDDTGACIARVNTTGTYKRIIGVGHKRSIADGFAHAETNAIFNRNLMEVRVGTGEVRDLTYTMYSVKFPCHDCARAIVDSGIKEIVYMSDDEKTPEAKKALDIGGVKCRKFVCGCNEKDFKIVIE